MANEELVQRDYLTRGRLKGEAFGEFEQINIGSTTVRELLNAGVSFVPPRSVSFPFKSYKPPKEPKAAKPDRVYLLRTNGHLRPVAVGENKAPRRLRDDQAVLKASEQGLYSAATLGAPVAVTTNGERYFYIDVKKSLSKGELVYFDERRDFNPAALQNLLAGDAGVARDPKPLAENVWQTSGMPRRRSRRNACLRSLRYSC